jgi:hypothetical protein
VQIVLTGDRWNARARRGEAVRVPVGAAYSGSFSGLAGAPGLALAFECKTLSNSITTVVDCQRLHLNKSCQKNNTYYYNFYYC